MIQRLASFARIGIVEDLSIGLKRNIIVSNIVFFNVLICCLLLSLTCLGCQMMVLAYCSIAFTSLVCILLNRYGYYSISRLTFLVIFDVGVFFVGILSESTISHADDRLFLLVNVLLVGVLFNIKEKFLMGFSFLLTMLLLIAFDPLREFFQTFLSLGGYPSVSGQIFTFKFALAGVIVFLCIFNFQFLVNCSDDKNEREISDKQTLLKEIHHRVKNNLQIISSLLSLQSNFLDEKGDKNVFQNTQGRIKTIAIVHEKLYKSSDVKNINLVEYLTSIVELVGASFYTESVTVSYDMQEDSLGKFSIEKAIPCGLIVNEIMTNAYKHAFKGMDNGEISIGFVKTSTAYKMTIQDNGVGFDADVEIKGVNSLGYELVDSLVSQLEGRISYESVKGTKITVEFP